MNDFVLIGIGGIIAILIAIYFVKRLIAFFINSIIGLLALVGWNYLFDPVVINIWSVLLTAFLGVFGLIIVVGLHYLGVLF